MADKADITPELCRQLLRYEPETGKLFWRPRPGFPQWTGRYAGKEAFTTIAKRGGYLCGRILDEQFTAHRVIFAITNGRWPVMVDHIDGNPLNNVMSNLRECTALQNQRNQKINSANTSGQMGVSWDSARALWSAEIKIKGKKRFLGRFAKKSDAIAARRGAEQSLGFHHNHGRHAALPRSS